MSGFLGNGCGKDIGGWPCGDFLDEGTGRDGECLGNYYYCKECLEELKKNMIKVNIIEYKNGSPGKSILNREFETELNALNFVEQFNSKNTFRKTPSYYTKAEMCPTEEINEHN